MYPQTLRVVHCISDGLLPVGDALGEATWRAGRLSAGSLPSRLPRTFPAVVSGPPGLCRVATKLLQQLGLPGENVEVLDPLPSVESEGPELPAAAQVAAEAKPPRTSVSATAPDAKPDAASPVRKGKGGILGFLSEPLRLFGTLPLCQCVRSDVSPGDSAAESPVHRFQH